MDSETAALAELANDHPDPEARIPDVPAFRHVMISEPALGMLYIAPHVEGLHPLEECAAIAEAFAVFIREPEHPSTAPIPEGRWWCSVDAGGLFELGGRCAA